MCVCHPFFRRSLIVIHTKQLRAELPEERGSGARSPSPGTTLADSAHVHKDMKIYVTAKLALKSTEPDYFHIYSTAVARFCAHLLELFSTGLFNRYNFPFPLYHDLHLFCVC